MTETSSPPELRASFKAESTKLEAKAGKPVRVEILAYTGGPMQPPGFPVVAINVAGIVFGESITLLADHENKTASVVGSGAPSVSGGKLFVAGTLSEATEAGRQVIQLHRDGVKWEASIGLRPTGDFKTYRRGESVNVNGRVLTAGPEGLRVYDGGELLEVSIVPQGADRGGTQVAITAKKGLYQMTADTGAAEAVQAERDRMQRIESRLGRVTDTLGAERTGELRIAAMCGKLTEAEFDGLIFEDLKAKADLRAHQAAAPKAPSPSYGGRLNASVDTPTVLAAAWHIRNNEAEAEKCYPSHVLEAGRDLARAGSLCEMLRAAAVREGFTPPANAHEMLTASHGGFSTVSVPTTLGNVANKSAAAQFAEDLRPLLEMFPAVSVSNLKEHTQIRMIDAGEMKAVGADGEVKSNTVKESVYTLQADTYAAKTTLTRKAIINDDAGVFDTLTRTHTLKALRGIKNTMMKRWLDGASFFTSGNKNLVTSNALSHAGLEAAMLKMRKQVDEEGRPIDLTPRYLFVPSELEHTALKLTRSDNFQVINNVADATGIEPTGNAFNGLIVRTDPRLSNTTYPGYSLSSWYLVGSDPSLAPMKTVFLNGQRSPVVEVFGYEADPTVLGWTVRVYMEWGAGFYEERSAVKSTV